jgi:hypothetical protein
MLRKLLLVAVICLFFVAFVRAQDDEDEKPVATTLLVYKHVKDYEAILNNNLTVTLTIYNVGESAAYDVNVKDNDWPEGSFDTIEGENKANFDKIEPGTNVTFSYTVVPRSTGEIETVPAIVTFKPVQDADETETKTARSNGLPKIPVLTQSEYDKRHDSHVDEWAIFFVLLSLPVGVPTVMYLFANNQIAALAAEKKKLKLK